VAEGIGDAARVESEVGGGLLLCEAFGQERENSAFAFGGIARALVDAEARGSVALMSAGRGAPY
jgi:hypothetical protein